MIRFNITNDGTRLDQFIGSNFHTLEDIVSLWKISSIILHINNIEGSGRLNELVELFVKEVFNDINLAVSYLSGLTGSSTIDDNDPIYVKMMQFILKYKSPNNKVSYDKVKFILKQVW